MFETLFGWQGKDLLRTALDRLCEMVAAGGAMFEDVTEFLWNAAPLERAALEERDASLNRMEEEIRALLFKHLAVAPAAGTFQCMVLMSLIRDAERIGDLCKYLLDAGIRSRAWREGNPFEARLYARKHRIYKAFDMTLRAFGHSDETLAREIVELKRLTDKESGELLEELLAANLDKDAGVVLGLMNHHTRRVMAHLGNIAGSVVLPAHKLAEHDKPVIPD